MSANATTVAATGQKKSAQGKDPSRRSEPKADALNRDAPNTPSLERAKEGGSRYHVHLPSLPAAWSYQRFDKILDVQGGSQPPKSAFVYEPAPGYVQLLQIRDFGDRGVPTFVREDSVTKRCTEDDILIARYGASLGRIVTGENGAYNVALAKVIFDQDQFFNRYLFYLLQTPFFQTPIHMISRSAQNGFNKGDLSDIILPVAPFPEQRQIVAEIEKQFTRLEAGVAALQRVQANLKRYRAAILKAACEGNLVPTEADIVAAASRRRTAGKQSRDGSATFETGEQLLERTLAQRRKSWPGRSQYKEPAAPDTASLPRPPAGWTWTTIDRVAECLDGKRVPVNKAERAKRQGEVPYYGANGQVGWIDTHIFDEPLVLVVEDETFTGRTQPFCYMIKGKTWVNNHAHVLRAAPAVSTAYLSYSLAFYPFTPRTTGSTGRRKLTQKALMTAPYLLPPLAEQTRIVAEVERRLSVVEELESVVSANLQRADRLRKSILQKAFTGQLV